MTEQLKFNSFKTIILKISGNCGGLGEIKLTSQGVKSHFLINLHELIFSGHKNKHFSRKGILIFHLKFRKVNDLINNLVSQGWVRGQTILHQSLCVHSP